MNSWELFSYWIFIWWLIYYLIYLFATRFGQKQPVDPSLKTFLRVFNPKLVFLIVLVFFILWIFYLFLKGFPTYVILLFLFANILLKLIPIYTLRNIPIDLPSNFIVSFVVFALYNFYLYFNKTNLVDIYQQVYEDVRMKRTPLMKALHSFLLRRGWVKDS